MSNASDLAKSHAVSVMDYVALLKPRVMSLVVFTAVVGYVVAPGGGDVLLGSTSILAIAAGAGAAAALNMWFDADIDAKMARTCARPIPAGRVSAEASLTLGLVLAAFSVLAMLLAANLLAAGLLAFTIFFYAVVYTMWLKRRTPQNIVIGGLAGAMPPAIAWAAKTGALSLDPILLVVIIFFWTPPHFWSLSLLRVQDYKTAGVPMLPVTHGPAETRKQILIYSLLLAPLALAPLATGLSGAVYGLVAGAGGIGFVALAVRLAKSGETRHARALFFYSIFYLFAIFAGLLAEA